MAVDWSSRNQCAADCGSVKCRPALQVSAGRFNLSDMTGKTTCSPRHFTPCTAGPSVAFVSTPVGTPWAPRSPRFPRPRAGLLCICQLNLLLSVA